jgi:hypothetical protein
MKRVAEAQERLDTSVPHPARRYNYWLGGKDNFAADRESGDAVVALFPSIRMAAVEIVVSCAARSSCSPARKTPGASSAG